MPKSIHDIPRVERPREKLIKYGPEKLSNAELLSILLRTGIKGYSILDISKNFFQKYTSQEILNLDFNELRSIRGLGTAKACEVLASIELGKRLLQNKKNIILLSPQDVWNEMSDTREKMKEYFFVIYLNSRQQKISKELISVGTLNASLIHPREVFESAIKNFAAGIILVHNHPSNDIEPSDADIKITKRLVNAGEILGIEIIDHVIVSKDYWFSFRERGFI